MPHPTPVILTKVRIQSHEVLRPVTLDPDFRQDDGKTDRCILILRGTGEGGPMRDRTVAIDPPCLNAAAFGDVTDDAVRVPEHGIPPIYATYVS